MSVALHIALGTPQSAVHFEELFTFSAHDVNLFGLFCFVFTNRKIFPSFKQVPPTCECAKHKVIEMREKLQKSNNVQKALVC